MPPGGAGSGSKVEWMRRCGRGERRS
uniref:Uncharacterized protein n=1 Tax=Arundo donax TaxID=35708 RepID=A0A0A9DP49_ARUDO